MKVPIKFKAMLLVIKYCELIGQLQRKALLNRYGDTRHDPEFGAFDLCFQLKCWKVRPDPRDSMILKKAHWIIHIR